MNPPLPFVPLAASQVWYDSPGSLAIKMGYLRALGIRGVGCWETGAVDYSASDQQAKAMWDAFAAFADPRNITLRAHVHGWKPPRSTAKGALGG